MELTPGDECPESRQQERAKKSSQRREACEAQRLLEHFANPEDLYDAVSPDDAYHDLKMTEYRQLAILHQVAMRP